MALPNRAAEGWGTGVDTGFPSLGGTGVDTCFPPLGGTGVDTCFPPLGGRRAEEPELHCGWRRQMARIQITTLSLGEGTNPLSPKSGEF